MTAAACVSVSQELIDAVLRPYKPHCRYVQSAVVEWAGGARATAGGTGNGRATSDDEPPPLARIRAELAIGDSCYIDDTGHFNSVEFNLCYNQLVYLLMAQCVVADLLPCFEAWSLDEYLARQLPDVLIHDFASRFKKPMHIASFQGTVDIMAASDRRRFLLIKTRCGFRDAHGGRSDGEVALAIVDRSAGDARAASGDAPRPAAPGGPSLDEA